MSAQFTQRPRRDDLAAMHARARAEIDDVIRAAHRLLIVLHDDDANCRARLQFLERGEQLLVIARMQADGRFVQDVKHAAEIGAQLRGEPDALRFAARKRRHAASELQIAEPDFVEEFQPLANLGQNIPRDFALRAR